MLERAGAAPGEEVCGLLGGAGEALRTFYPVDNSSPDRARRYLMDPAQQIAAMRRMRERGEELLGIFHSHTQGPAAPSPVDLELAAYPDTFYFIAAPGNPPELRAWRYDGKGFTEVAVRGGNPRAR